MALPKVGILAEDLVQQHRLRDALTNYGFEVIFNSSPSKLKALPSIQPDAWIVDLCEEDDQHYQWLDELLSSDKLVLLGLQHAPQKTCPTYPKWEKRLYSKLRSFIQITPVLAADESTLTQLPQVNVNNQPPPKAFQAQDFSNTVAKQVWMLGASLGGPAAVKSFLDSLPAGLPVAFIYAQHIDPRFEKSLPAAVGRHCHYKLKNFIENEPLYCSEVLIAPIEHEFYFQNNGLPISANAEWPGPYGPSIDQVIVNIDKNYGANAGYILFSGMGNDGADAITQKLSPGTPVWAQTPTTCANSSMPDSAIATGKVTYTGSPQDLALQLVNHVNNYWVTSYEPTIN